MTSLLVFGLLVGFTLAVLLTLLVGVYTIGPTERGIVTTFRRAQRIQGSVATDPELGALNLPEEQERYNAPLLRVISPGGPFFKWPWQRLYRIDMTIQTTDITWDPDIEQTSIEAVTKDNLTVSITGQIRWKPCERNLYPYLFGVSKPAAHVMGFFVSVLRDRIATFHGESNDSAVEGISINDLRKNLSSINRYMEEACRKTATRYGIELDAALITTIDPPADVDGPRLDQHDPEPGRGSGEPGASGRRPEAHDGRTGRANRAQPGRRGSRPTAGIGADIACHV